MNPSPELRLMRLANAFQLSRAVQVAARLRLGELLGDGPRSCAELAAETATQERVLHKLLRFLGDLGVVEERADGTFAGTEVSERLFLVDNIAQGEESAAAWGGLLESLADGEPAFPAIHGRTFYEHAAAHPDRGRAFAAWNRILGGSLGPALGKTLNLTPGGALVDLGGGDGSVLASILQEHPACRGVLVDLPEAVVDAPEILRDAGVESRCRVMAGDVRGDLPEGQDAYLLCRVLLNWDDGEAEAWLRRIRDAMGPESRLFVVEELMPGPGEPRGVALASSDLHLFLMWGGGHRTFEEMDALLERCGLERTDLGRVGGGDDGPHLLTARRSGST